MGVPPSSENPRVALFDHLLPKRTSAVREDEPILDVIRGKELSGDGPRGSRGSLVTSAHGGRTPA